jgi:hypothetical protein
MYSALSPISKQVRNVNKITKDELWKITKEKPTEIQIKSRKWNWIAHTLRKKSRNNTENRIGLEFSGV